MPWQATQKWAARGPERVRESRKRDSVNSCEEPREALGSCQGPWRSVRQRKCNC